MARTEISETKGETLSLEQPAIKLSNATHGLIALLFLLLWCKEEQPCNNEQIRPQIIRSTNDPESGLTQIRVRNPVSEEY